MVRRSAAVLIILGCALLAAVRPAAAATVIGFNDLSVGSVVTQQYSAKGVTFTGARVVGDATRKYVRATSNGGAITMTFASPVANLRIDVAGHLVQSLVGKTPQGDVAAQNNLDFGDPDGTEVIWVPLGISSAAGITSATVTVPGSQAFLDSLEFDVLPAGISITPSSHDFGSVAVKQATRPLTLSVKSTGPAPLRVTGMRIEPSSAGAVFVRSSSCTAPLPRDAVCTVTVTFTPQDEGLRTATLVVVHNGPNGSSDIGLRGSGTRSSPAASVAPSRLEFGVVDVGTARTQNLTIANTGNADLPIDSITVDDGEFTVGTCPGSFVGWQQRCTVPVEYRPGKANARTATLTVDFGGSEVPNKTVVVTGEGRSSTVTTEPGPSTTTSPGTRRLEANPRSVEPLDEVTVSGSGFRGATRLFWDVEHDDHFFIAVEADWGTVRAFTKVPSDTAPGPRRILACDESRTCEEARLTVTTGPPPPSFPIAAVIAAAVVLLGVFLGWLGLHGGSGRRPPTEPPPPTPIPGHRGREVRTGFSSADDIAEVHDGNRPLVAGRAYHFWLELGPPVIAGGGGRAPLTVALFDYAGELEIDAGLGRIEVGSVGESVALAQGGLHGGVRQDGTTLRRRVHFPVRTGSRPGDQRLRCGLYHEQVLVQSWVITAPVQSSRAIGWRVAAAWRRLTGRERDLVERRRDYVLASSLDPGHLAGLEPHRLSLMLNRNDADTYGFRLLGEKDFRSTAEFPASTVAALRDELRRVLEEIVAGGGGQARYRYAGGLDTERLYQDLIRLAYWGYEAYARLNSGLAAGAPGDGLTDVRNLAALMREPGRVQVANKVDATEYIPVAFFYDHPLRTGSPNLRICPAFSAALEERAALKDSPCFGGHCPSHGDTMVVCPSGFWGYRHVIGMPQTVGEAGIPDVPLELPDLGGTPVPVGVSTDPSFVERVNHQKRLQDQHPAVTWQLLDTMDTLLTGLRDAQPALVYFYGHGGKGPSTNFFEIGPPGTDNVFTPSMLLSSEILWHRSHPLVFVNGCHTGAVGPGTPLSLVDGFIRHAQAAGVIGSQVTVFEPLACAFAERFLHEVLNERRSVGDAIRTVRLSLLAEGNPLGLVYVPFVTDDLRLPPGPVAAATERGTGRASVRP